MPTESTSAAHRAGERDARYRPGLFVLLFLFVAVLALAIPLSASGLQPHRPSKKEVLKRLPAAPAGVRAGLPYESRPPEQGQEQGRGQGQDPQRHGGPDAFGYVYDDDGEPGVVYSWTDGITLTRIPDTYWQATRSVSSTSTLDDGVMTDTMPFSFNYYGTSYSQIHISTNGNVHFGAPNDWYPDQSNACLPYNHQYVPQGMIAPLWYDLVVPPQVSGTGGVYTSLIGTAPNQIYMVQWRRVREYNPPNGYATFEVLLYQTGEIYLQYKELTTSSLNGEEGVIGIQNLAGSIGLPYSCYQSSVIEERAIRYKLREAAFLTPSSSQRGGAAGATITYGLNLLNRTGSATSFEMTHRDTYGWPTTIDPLTTTLLADGVSTRITVTVQMPPNTPIGSSNTTVITATSTSSPHTARAVLVTTVNSFGADFSPGAQVHSGAFGSSVTYSARVTNRSPQTNTFDLNLVPSSAPWTSTISPSSVSGLAPEASAPVTVMVQIPPGSTFGASDAVEISATGQYPVPWPTPGAYHGSTVLTTTAGTWERTGNTQYWRSRGAGVLFPPNGKVYAIGGESFGGNVDLPIEEYDPYARTWTPRASLQVGVSNAGVAVIGNAIYVAGGYNAQYGGAQSLLQVYYPFEDRTDIIATDPLPAPRLGAGVASSATTYGGKLYVIGGSNNSLVGTNTLFIYDPAGAAHTRWSQGPSMRTARVYLAAATLGSRIYAAGGMPGAPVDLATVESYSLVSPNTWRIESDMIRPRAGLALVGVDRTDNDPGCGGYLFALGGGWQSYESSTERYDPTARRWGLAPNLRVGRRSLMAAAAYSSVYNTRAFALLAFGGWSGTYENVSESAQCGGAAPPPAPTPTATPCAMPFTDVQPSDYFYRPVNYLYCAGVISGYADNTFKPYNPTTRGQLAKIVVLAEGWTLYTPPTPTFRDVPPDHAFYPFIETAYSHGIISGYSCGSGCLEYRPSGLITRSQLAKIVVLAEGWPLADPPTPTFWDVPATNPFYRHVETAYARGIISGYGDGTFRPGYSATRGQICKIVYLAVTGP